ncbi:MAG TPA: TrkH family potassium uptake protein [Vicinamibacterales bacterium]|jgi:trk system potassium uptake protein TrkH|nr:TrkH family potassium uptake protein [Vicinamibacterales bacterium]
MRLAVVVHLTGVLVRLFGPMLLLPALVALYYRELGDAAGFAATGVGTVALGQAMRMAGGREVQRAAERLRRVEGMTTVAASWLVMAHLAAVPYMWAGMGFIDAVFESMSGLTTTGATVMRDFSLFGRGIFFWRALTHWLGGMGVIALFVAVLPRLAIGGRELFFAEASGPTDEKLTPQIRQTALVLWRLYAGLTAAQVVALWAAGMSLYDSVCHSMATLAAGGFSPHPASIAGYASPLIEWIICFFMFLAGANFALQFRAVVRGNAGALLRDEEFRAYTGVVLASTAVLAVLLAAAGRPLLETIRPALFQVLSILTTTGFASEDFNLWSEQAKVVLLALMFIGGCAGSAGGGPKVVRHVLMARFTLRELRRTLHPRAVLPVKLGGRVVPDETMREVVVFMLFYILTFALGAGIVVLLGADLVTGISGAAATIGNVGPGFNAIGPMGHFGDLHPISKIVLTLEMWIGRLEVLTVLVLFRAEAWRSARWQL